MTSEQLRELREDIVRRRSGGTSTRLELREYQRMMKRVIAADPFIGKGTPIAPDPKPDCSDRQAGYDL